jgi:phosphatidate cytidylyltransferase
MAFNWQSFKTRTLTAAIFVVVMLAGLLLSGLSFIILFLIIHFGCWYEFVRLAKKIKPLAYGYFLPIGLLYITLPLLFIVDLGFPNTSHWLSQRGYEDAFDYSPIIPCAIIFSIWINDTMAYIVGSLIGRTPLSKISPRKTWEGTMGGIILCIVVIGLTFSNIPTDTVLPGYHFHFASEMWYIIAAIASIAGTFGDLLESKLKRLAGVKDSGHIMPGHGGFLDRFDSLLVAIPFVWLYVYFFMQ